jgi:hypothetical protein
MVFAPTSSPGAWSGGRSGIHYRGWMQVEPDGEGSKLTLHLSTARASDIKQYVASTFESIRRQF